MNNLFLALRSIKKHPFNFILIIIELAALFLAENYVVSAINDRQMLNKPFAKILNENSAFVFDEGYFNEFRLDPYGAAESRAALLDGISDEYACYDVLTYIDADIKIVSVNDDLYSRLNLPLVAGNRSGAIGSFAAQIGKQTFDLDGKRLTLNVTGRLTNSTYVPEMSAYSSFGMTTKDLFANDNSKGNFIITNRSSIEPTADRFFTGLGFIIMFKTNAQSNIEHLRSITYSVDGTEIQKNSRAALKEDLSDFAPLITTLFVIVIIGLVSISVITYSSNARQNGILWICGYSRKQIIMVHIVNISVLLTLSLALSVATFFIMQMLEIETAKTVVLSVWNIWASVALFALFGGIALIIPAVKSAKTSPVEYLRRTL